MELTLQDMKTLSELMDRALDLDAESRSRWLSELTQGPHAALQPFLAEMLQRQANMETAFLVRPIELPETPARGSATATGGAFAPAKLTAGARIGPYVLQREIGQGGMGAVWLADRADGVMKRQVALKLPTIHLSDALAERFARERDILAQLSHANIARLYDAGVSDTGRPYLALEYIEGKPITEHCDAIALSVDERLRRFLQVAAAVQFAHANLVIHRDLKPGNILVSEDGQVHLLDFGIAKLLDEPKGQAQETELTMLAGRALTLDYASPEQVSGAAISTASDVYSMGVVLYQLLSGQKPYVLKRGSRAELEEAILATDAARMSDAVLRGDESLATLRGTSRARLGKTLAGDLDTIVARAMKKDPVQRYATVAAFADDIQRHLDGLPVEAQPDSWRYRAGKFVSRHRIGVAASAAVTVALLAAFGTALWQADVARSEARRADAEARVAKREASRGDAVQGFLLDLFAANSHDQKNAVEIGKLTARQLLDRGTEKLQADNKLPDDVNSVLFRLFGELYENQDEMERSIALHQRSVKAAEAAYGRDSRQYALALLEQAWVQFKSRPGKPPIELVDSAKAILARVAPGSEEYAQALYFEAEFVDTSNPARALKAASESVRIMEQLGVTSKRYAFALRALGFAQRLVGDVDASLGSFTRAVKVFADLYGSDGIEVGITKGEISTSLRLLLRLHESEQQSAEAVALLRPYQGEMADVGGYGQRWVRVMLDLGRVDEATKRIETAYAASSRKDSRTSDMAASIAQELANVRAARGDAERAFALLRRHTDEIPGGWHTVRVSMLSRYARIAMTLGDVAEARGALDEASALRAQRGLPLDHSRELAIALAELRAIGGDRRAALAEFDDFQKRFPHSPHSRLTQLSIALGKARVHARLGDWSLVKTELAPWLADNYPEGTAAPVHMKAEAMLLDAEGAIQSKSTDAAQLLARAVKLLEQNDVPDSRRLREARAKLATLRST